MNESDNFSIPPEDDDDDNLSPSRSGSTSSTTSSQQDYDAGDTGLVSGEDYETIAADLDIW